ncbi:ATP synthase F1 subunit delta [[Clostridium] polysaccharolyticum]|uniref:ATP synthase subunit delta n=1 Tax=[Clostridium] polysaccharolyticum TaxID=29364 RepID=A0A1I0BS78_9FIRM|nr:ATP synthase F1 subunit delta [[Clostridium] polysaccharolyticum]SET09474.1 F-type H+-transporting ATPase subunit delta [[Clostridium] polysaccharolyticum]
MAKLVSKTYGQALFELALEENALEQILEEEAFVKEVFADYGDLVTLLNHPKISKDEKIQVVENIFKGKISDTMLGFLVIVVTKERYDELEQIFQYLEEKVKEYKNIGVVSVTTAVELSEEQKARLTQRLLEVTSFKQLEFSYSVNPQIIGGMILRIGDRIVDSSIRTEIDQMAKSLLKIQLS